MDLHCFQIQGFSFLALGPIALRKAKTLWSFGHSECNRLKHVKVLNICKQGCANNIGSDQAGQSLCCSYTLITRVFEQCSSSSVGSMLAANLAFLGSYPLAKEIFSTVNWVPSPVCLSLSPSHCLM